MRLSFSVLAASSYLCVLSAILSSTESKILETTADRILQHGYPVETHTVTTSDDYILKMFRIPYSPKLQNMNQTKPIVFLQHGFSGCSDVWTLTGPDNALAFLLVDAGYDVWMGNSRGNIYSRKHVHLSPNSQSFWDHSWHEIALFDLPANIDYILDLTNQTALYYVGHSQGTTLFFVLMSTNTSYNQKIKIGFMLAPTGYANNAKSPLPAILAPFFGRPSLLSRIFSTTEFLSYNEQLSQFLWNTCGEKSPLQGLCANFIFLAAGFDSKYLNYTNLPYFLKIYPAGTSFKQIIHYTQEYVSGHFRQYDYGMKENLRRYKRQSPPDYQIENITAKVVFLRGANDWLSDTIDVQRLAVRMPNLIKNHLVPVPEWTHLDFVCSRLVKAQVSDKIIDIANENEALEQSALV